MTTVRELDARGISVSRVEERHPRGWLGRVLGRDVDTDPPDWWDRAGDRDPTEREENA